MSTPSIIERVRILAKQVRGVDPVQDLIVCDRIEELLGQLHTRSLRGDNVAEHYLEHNDLAA